MDRAQRASAMIARMTRCIDEPVSPLASEPIGGLFFAEDDYEQYSTKVSVASSWQLLTSYLLSGCV
jgi:hypothetical protein